MRPGGEEGAPDWRFSTEFREENQSGFCFLFFLTVTLLQTESSVKYNKNAVALLSAMNVSKQSQFLSLSCHQAV